MIVKNIGSTKKFFQFGRGVRGRELAAGEQTFIPDSEVALNKAQEYAASGDLAIVGGPAVTTVLTPASIPASLPVTLQATPSDGDTITVDGVVFTFRTTDDNAATTAAIGASAATAATAMAAKIAAYSGGGFAMTAQAGTTIAGDQAIILYSKRPGVKGNGAYNAENSTGHTVTVVGSNITRTIAAPAGGRDSQTVKVVTFKDTLAGGFTSPYQVFTGFEEIVNIQLTVLTAAGAPKAITDTVITQGGTVQIVAAGATNLAATDSVHLTITGK